MVVSQEIAQHIQCCDTVIWYNY